MNICFAEPNRLKIEELLAFAQNRCTQRLLTFDRMAEILSSVEKELSISKAKMKGISITYTGAERFPASYRYSPECTSFDAKHDGKLWHITDIHRMVCPNRNENLSLTLTDEAKDALIESFRRFRV